MTSLLISLLACTEESEWKPLGEGFENSSTEDDTNTEPGSEPGNEVIDVDFELGDPISTTSTFPENEGGGGGGGNGPNIMYEWTDAAVFNDQYAIQVGVSGASVVKRDNGEIATSVENFNRAYRVDAQGDMIIIGSRTDRLTFFQMTSPPEMVETHQIQPDGTHEDVAVYGDVVAVTWRDQGLKIYDTSGSELITIPAEDAFTVDIFEQTLVYTDKKNLIILDVSNPSDPQELDRLELSSEGRDLAFNGERIAVGLGGNGVATFVSQDGSFAQQDEFVFDGAALSVALDGEYLWTATWNSVWLTWVGGSQAVHLGQESPKHSAMGLDAEGGKAIIADWYNSTVMVQNEGLWGPEVSLPAERFFANGGSDTQSIPITNYSSQELIVNFTPPTDFSLNETSFTVDPGKSEYIRVTSPSSSWHQMMLEWTSNDPDEVSGSITLRSAEDGVGSPHTDFTLPLITAADGMIGNVSLGDYQGKVLFLAWWSDY